MNCTQILYPPDLTQTAQPIDRHIGTQYKRAVYQAGRAESMRLLANNSGATTARMKPLAKRVLITKVVADTHERLARCGAFRRSFVATGT